MDRKPALKDHVHVYAKEVYTYRADNSKAKAYTITINGKWEIHDEVLEFLYAHDWEERYSDVTFVLYKTNQYLNKED